MADPDQRQNNEVDPGNQNGGGQDNRNGNENGNGADGGTGLLGFAQIGEIFNDATSRLIGGVDNSNKAIVVEDLTAVQSALRDLLAAEPEAFQGTAAIRAQSVIDQINLELAAVNSLGDDPFAPKYISDVHRDLIDIVQGDEGLSALAREGGRNGFANLPDTLAPAGPFQGNAEQTEFMRNFAAGAADIADRAIALADEGAGPGSEEVGQLVADIQDFVANSSAFTFSQGGLYSARFDNEFADDGVNGTASRALAEALQTGNFGQVHAAAEILAANAEDVAGNMLGIGDDPVVINNGIPDQIDSFAVAGTVFNDAMTQLVGGVYQGNQSAIINDLEATRSAVEHLIGDDAFEGATRLRAQMVVDHLGLEIAAVEAAADGSAAFPAAAINDIHGDIIEIVASDAELSSLADESGLSGFSAPPDRTAADPAFSASSEQIQFVNGFVDQAASLGAEASQAVIGDGDADIADLIGRISGFASAADQFVAEQGGLYEALFADELALSGTNGTVTQAMIDGLQQGNADVVHAAQEELLLNAMAVADDQTFAGEASATAPGMAVAEVEIPPDVALEMPSQEPELAMVHHGHFCG